MGACVSLNKDAAKLRLWSKNETKLVIPSRVKETVNAGDRDVAAPPKPRLSSARFAGSKDESFFDSQPWLESDCEDDFYSVNGDFTPSRGSTPVHHSFAVRVNNKTSTAVEEKADTPPDSSPTDKRKRLSELFKDSLRAPDQQQPVEDANAAQNDNDEAKSNNLAQSTNGTQPNVSVTTSTEKTTNGVIITEDGSDVKSGQCCLPRLISNRSFNEEKKRTSPTRSDG